MGTNHSVLAAQAATVYLDAWHCDGATVDAAEFGDCNGDALDARDWSYADDVSGTGPTAMGTVDGYCPTLVAA